MSRGLERFVENFQGGFGFAQEARARNVALDRARTQRDRERRTSEAEGEIADVARQGIPTEQVPTGPPDLSGAQFQVQGEGDAAIPTAPAISGEQMHTGRQFLQDRTPHRTRQDWRGYRDQILNAAMRSGDIAMISQVSDYLQNQERTQIMSRLSAANQAAQTGNMEAVRDALVDAYDFMPVEGDADIKVKNGSLVVGGQEYSREEVPRLLQHLMSQTGDPEGYVRFAESLELEQKASKQRDRQLDQTDRRIDITEEQGGRQLDQMDRRIDLTAEAQAFDQAIREWKLPLQADVLTGQAANLFSQAEMNRMQMAGSAGVTLSPSEHRARWAAADDVIERREIDDNSPIAQLYDDPDFRLRLRGVAGQLIYANDPGLTPADAVRAAERMMEMMLGDGVQQEGIERPRAVDSAIPTAEQAQSRADSVRAGRTDLQTPAEPRDEGFFQHGETGEIMFRSQGVNLRVPAALYQEQMTIVGRMHAELERQEAEQRARAETIRQRREEFEERKQAHPRAGRIPGIDF